MFNPSCAALNVVTSAGTFGLIQVMFTANGIIERLNKQTGEKMTVEIVKRVKEWFWISDSGKINLAIKYGAKTLTLNKKTKANCIELNNGEELITTLKALKTDVLNGALDEAITEVSSATRKAFGK